MAPPLYSDLGKQSRDLFSKGYNFGFLKLDTTTKSGDVEFKTGAAHNVNSQKLNGNIQMKYKLPKYGMTLTEKWATDNTLYVEVAVQDKVAKGVKLTFENTYAPALGKRSGKAKVEYGVDRIRFNGDVNLDTKGPLVNAAVVGAHEGWLAGANLGFDTQSNKVKSTSVSVARDARDYSIHTFINEGSEFGGNLFHRVNNQLQLGANLGWRQGTEGTSFGIAAKYQLAPETTVQAKVSNSSQVAAAMVHDLNNGFKLTLSSLINLQNFNEGGHKFGLGLEYNN